MTSKEALKRLWQETAPATYMKDFDKKACCDAIEKDLEMLEIIKNHLFYKDGLLCFAWHIANEDEKTYKKLENWVKGKENE